MAQCYQCGLDVEETDRFCMECGALDPAHPPLVKTGGDTPAIRPTQPTWLPADGVPAMARVSTPASMPRSQLSPADSISCPRCGAALPRGARFCGDCGERIGGPPAGTPGAVMNAPETPIQAHVAAPPIPKMDAPAAWMPPAQIAPALPDPIAPPTPLAADRSAANLAKPVLPPFRASSWAAQPTPEVEIPDHTWTPLTSAQPVGTPSQMFWAESSPPPVNPAGYPPSPAPAPSQGFAGVSLPQVKAQKRSKHPRGQVITMLVAVIVTVVAATAGIILQFFVK